MPFRMILFRRVDLSTIEQQLSDLKSTKFNTIVYNVEILVVRLTLKRKMYNGASLWIRRI